MITITVSGFKTKDQAIAWLNQYEGGVEQSFDTETPIKFPAMCSMEQYIPEMQAFEKDTDKTNFNLHVK